MRAFLAEQIFEPLGLRSTSADGIPTGANIARGQHEGQPLVSREIPTIVGTSDIWSTVGDLARFTTAVHSGSLLSLASQRTRLTAHTPLGGEGASDGAWMTDDGYGYGVFIGTIAGHTSSTTRATFRAICRSTPGSQTRARASLCSPTTIPRTSSTY